MNNPSSKTLQTTLRLSYAMRAQLDDVRISRARATGDLPPSLNDLLHEAIEALLRGECTGDARAAKTRRGGANKKSKT